MSNSITETKNGYVRSLTLVPPFDKRHSNPNKNYGIGGINLRCELIKNCRAVQFVAFLGIHLPHVTEELWHNSKSIYNPFSGMDADVGYHSPTAQYEGQKPLQDDCPITKGLCYYDGSGLRAEKWYKIFLEEGIDKIWEMLEIEYVERFEE